MGITLGIDVAVALGVLSVFSLLRVARWSRRWYAPSRFRTAADAAAAAAGHPGHPLPGAPQPPPLPRTLLTWLLPLMRLREEDVLRVSGGLDVVMYLRVIRFGARGGWGAGGGEQGGRRRCSCRRRRGAGARACASLRGRCARAPRPTRVCAPPAPRRPAGVLLGCPVGLRRGAAREPHGGQPG